MQCSSGAIVRAAPYNYQSSNRQYIAPRPDRWVRNAVEKIGSAFGQSTTSSSLGLPQTHTPCATTSVSNPHNLPSQRKILHLSMCMHSNRRHKILCQDRVDNFTTDRTLLCFLRAQYTAHCGRFLKLVRLKSVERIEFVKFLLPMGGSVALQGCIPDNTNSTYCDCIPPPQKVGLEYEYSPNPPKTHPPFPPEYLASLFTCNSKVDEQDDWILNQIPKRTCGELRGQKGDPAEGWGIYFVESWDHKLISLLILVVFLVASSLFGILYSRFHFDVQGAFGVSAWMIACSSMMLQVAATWLDNTG